MKGYTVISTPKVEKPRDPDKAQRVSLAERALFRPKGRESLISGGMQRKPATRKPSLLSGAGGKSSTSS